MYILYYIFGGVLIFIDRLTKKLALNYMKNGPTIKLPLREINLSYVENRGAAFGILQNHKILLIFITIVALCVLVYYFFDLPITYNWTRISLVLIFSGATGNFLDRIFCGYVVDFIELTFVDFPVFNFADIFLTVGSIIFAFIILFGRKVI